MNILVTGSNGQLGTALSNLFKKHDITFTAVDLPEFDITNAEMTARQIDEINPDIIINAAAYTNVKNAELELNKALQINAACLKNLSEICNQRNIYLCHISTDYVFDGTKKIPYLEADPTNPVNCYGFSKELGEKIIQTYCEDFVIIRTAALYGRSKLNSENVLDKIINYAKQNNQISSVVDEYTSPTFSHDLAKQILLILQNKIKGIVHATSEGYCNWYDFVECICDLLKIKVEIQKVDSADFSQGLKKPLFSVLENSRLKALNINVMPPWKEALKKYLKNF